ncbi:unnamed protein product [Medioppia subpectinata]|uniref:Peptidase S1 domain-containing protein n=1 Tax=Medioppia subpectinata TaxID=1979941 RepID=A0A7R9PWT5_9ACAR|nr:unnamed protein product [Medioppia subpectinata]CAG2103231.1 unnamed protein product [Medioppia subpectinata]
MGATNYAPYFHLGDIRVSTGDSGSISAPDCGLAREDFIVGGERAAVGSQPWIAAIYYNGQHWAAAVIVTEWWLITAAHNNEHVQFTESQDPGAYSIKVGSNNRINGESYKVSRIKVHEKYNMLGQQDSDIAMFKVHSAIKMKPTVQPICMPTTPYEEPLNDSLTVSGWGKLNYLDGDTPTELMVERLDMYPIEKPGNSCWSDNEYPVVNIKSYFLNVGGYRVLAVRMNRYLQMRCATAVLASINANLIPTQFRGPVPNGI